MKVDIKKSVETAFKLSDIIDELKYGIDHLYADKNLNNTSTRKTKEIVRMELLRFLVLIVSVDGRISQEEVNFINYYLDMSPTLSVYQLQQLVQDAGILSTETIEIPLGISIFKEADNRLRDENVLDSNTGNIAEFLLNIFELIGKEIMLIDSKVTEKEVEIYTKYIKFYKDYLNNYQENVKTNSSNSNIVIKSNNENKNIGALLDELNALIGLESVKNDVNSLINLIQIRKLREKRGIKQPTMSLHLVFSGNPGTGKTTVARLLAKIYNKIGVLSKGHLVEVDRSGLVGGYVGQTALKVKDIVNTAMGGVLFIDEAYSLSSSKDGQDYGKEAIDTLLKAMEDNREDFIVIVAGYPELMNEFLESNPGLKSRFNKYIMFEDYKPEELLKIFEKMCKDSNFTIDETVKEFVKDFFEQRYIKRSENFANARDVRNFFEKTLINQANRLSKQKKFTDNELIEIKLEDVENIKLK